MEKLKQALGSFLLLPLLAMFAVPSFLFAEEHDEREIGPDSNTVIRPESSLIPISTDRDRNIFDEERRAFRAPISNQREPATLPSRERIEIVEIQERINARRALVEKREDALASRREEMRNIMKQRADTLNQAQERHEEVRNRLSEEAGRRVQNATQVVFKRFNNAIERMQSVASRIESRIEKLENRGHDMSLSKESLRMSVEILAVLESDLLEARSATELMVQSEDPRELFLAIRSLVREMRTSLESTRQSFLETLRAIRAGVEAGLQNQNELE